MKTEIRQVEKTKGELRLVNYQFQYGSAGWDHSSNWTWNNVPNGHMIHTTGNTDTISQSNVPFIVGYKYRFYIPKQMYFVGMLYPFNGSYTISFGGINSYTIVSADYYNYNYGGSIFIKDMVVDGTDIIITPSSDCNLYFEGIFKIIFFGNQTLRKLDLYDDVSLNLNFSVNDIRDISKRNSTYSKTIKIPATDNNNLFFNNQMDVNVQTTLNDNYLYKPIQVDLYYNSVLIQSGNIKLINIINNIEKPEYEIQFYGEYADLASTLGDQKIFGNSDISNDIDVSDMYHVFDLDVAKTTWATGSTNSGFTYPLIDYRGYEGAANEMLFKYLKPAIFVKELFDRIIEDAGFTYDSDFLNSKPFTNLVNPWTGAEIISDQDWLYDNRKIEAYLTYDYNWSSNDNVIKYNNEYDDGDQYNNTGAIVGGIYPWSIKVKNSGEYDIIGTININYINWYSVDMNLILYDITNDIVVGNGSILHFPSFSGSLTGTTYLDINIELEKDVQYQFRLNITNNYNVNLFYILSNSYFKVNPSKISPTVYEGDYIDMSKIFGGKVPKKIDYITSIINMFNLIVDEDPLRYKHLLIENHTDYYSGGTYLDWTNKIDVGSEKITKLIEYVDKSVYLSHIKDDDDLNVDFTNKNNKVYGEKIHQNDIKSTDLIKIETIYSPTPIGYYGTTPILMSKIYNIDDKKTIATNDDEVIIKDFNPRILYYDKVPITPLNNYTLYLEPEAGNSVCFDYVTAHGFFPTATHVDNPYKDVYDFNFGNNKTYYWDISGGTITYQNLWWMYYRNFLDSMLDYDSKLVKYQIKLTENDISNFKFSDTIRIDNTSYIVNKIINWNPGELCEIELLKLSNNYLKFRKASSGIPVDAYYTKNKDIRNFLVLTKPDVSMPVMYDASGNSISDWDPELYGDLPSTNLNTNKLVSNSNCIITGIYNELNDTYNSQVIGDYNIIKRNESGDNSNENIIIIGSNNKIE